MTADTRDRELNYALLEECVSWAFWNAELDRKPEAANLKEWWDQSSWSSSYSARDCGTSFCIAGYVALVSGFVQRISDSQVGQECPCGGGQNWKVNIPVGFSQLIGVVEGPPCFCGGDDYDEVWSSLGVALLGITEEEGDRLFEGGNSIDDVLSAADEICEARSLPSVNPHKFNPKVANGRMELIPK